MKHYQYGEEVSLAQLEADRAYEEILREKQAKADAEIEAAEFKPPGPVDEDWLVLHDEWLTEERSRDRESAERSWR